MFGNIYQKYLLRHIRDKDMFIWTLLFPMILATLFFLAFSSLDDSGKLSTIPVAVTEKGWEEEPYFGQMLDTLTEGENPLIQVYEKEQEECQELLKQEKVAGIISLEQGKPLLQVKKQGMDQTILKSILDRYLQTKAVLTEVAEQDPQFWRNQVQTLSKELGVWETYTRELNLTSRKPLETLSYFYALLAMTCLYGGFYGLHVIVFQQANLSVQGAVNTVSPVSRLTLFAASFLAALTVQAVCILATLAYLILVLGIDFGQQLFLVILLCILGSALGVAFGAVLALPSRFKMNRKIGILVCSSLLCSALSGLMYDGLKYQVEVHAPWLAAINPAARIADGFYCLYYYDSNGKYWNHMGALLFMTVAFLGICVICIRRKQYESI